ncbi:alpha/beta hydrolase family protein [Siphonobacter sp. SORGH_AS_1065]|uniref:alpha/beta hydrolase n=1 Tax=Siphonobacter sp. SORGH_AS_1065 TaxID=3041795 RepID=UPI002785F285|nr:alpha/beta hydrolase family protein [Siphonobacter sp. SORGH_AS_1065]MDQ1088716.1 S-formylglutathione hydrolase FrmB [Siphonobacter sp. SORGH_AS_1065]
MKLFRNLSIIAFSLLAFSSFAAKVDTVDTYSASMKKTIKAVVITPDSYASGKAFPVLYLLHGYSGNYSDWAKKHLTINELADQYQMMIVCADGNFSSWYFDSPIDPSYKYETYVANELPAWIDSRYKTVKSREGRGIAGLSMGGHGALYLAFKHQDVFGAAGSMSGGVDFRPFPNNWDIAKRLGTYAQTPENWEKYTVINMVHLLTPNSLALLIDCGTEDFFYGVNENLHAKLIERNIPHDYINRPGAHNWGYWNKALTYQALFMKQFFDRKK